MINKICIYGYKSYKNLELELQPFNVFYGLNASGKSNFLEVFSILGKLTKADHISTAFRSNRDKLDQFESYFSFSNKKKNIKISVEGEFSSAAKDYFNEENNSTYKSRIKVLKPNFKYEIEIEYLKSKEFLDLETFQILEETLDVFGPKVKSARLLKRNKTNLTVMYEGRERTRDLTLENVKQSQSALKYNYDFNRHPHLCSFIKELKSWKFYHVNPANLRESSSISSIFEEEVDPTGKDLTATLYFLKEKYNSVFQDLKHNLYDFIPIFKEIDVQLEPYTRKINLTLIEDLGEGLEQHIPISGLSDGTLRILHLITAILTPIHKSGLLTIEELENGIHNNKLALFAEKLIKQSLYRDQQIIIATHSRKLIETILAFPERYGVCTADYFYRCSLNKKNEGTTIINHKRESRSLDFCSDEIPLLIDHRKREWEKIKKDIEKSIDVMGI